MSTQVLPAVGAVDRELLARVPIFGGLPPQMLDRIIEVGSLVEAAEGQQVMGEGEPALSVFVVCQGELEIAKRGSHGAPVRLAGRHPRDRVGGMPLSGNQPPSAAV